MHSSVLGIHGVPPKQALGRKTRVMGGCLLDGASRAGLAVNGSALLLATTARNTTMATAYYYLPLDRRQTSLIPYSWKGNWYE